MKKLLNFMIIIMSITLCGCWGHVDLNELNILYGLSVDFNKDNKYVFITEGISPIGSKEEHGGKSKVNYYTSTGESIFGAARNLTNTAAGKRNFYQSCQAIIIGQSLCEDNITPVIDFFTRDAKRRLTIYPLVFEGNILDLPQKMQVNEEPLSTKLVNIINLHKYTGYSVHKNLAETVTYSKGVPGTVLLNKFKIDTNNNNEPVIDGTGVFYKNKLVGNFDSEETMVANIISKDINRAVVVVNKDNNLPYYNNITVEISKFKTKFLPVVEDDKYVMKVDIKMVGKIVEYSEGDSLLEYNFKELENIVSKYLTDLINKTYLKSKIEFKVDALGFGEYFSKKYKYISKMKPEEWNYIFNNNFELKLNLKTNIVNTGSTVEKSD